MPSIDYNKRFCIGVVLNLIIVVAEILYGIKANSIALISDGLHNAMDVLGLLLAWGSYFLLKKKGPKTFTYGFKQTTLFAALLNSLLLFAAVGGIAWEAFLRLDSPQPIAISMVIVVASIGAVVNTGTALLFLSGKRDLNIRGAFLHMASDAAVSLSVVVGSILIALTGFLLFDPILSLLISLVIFISSWRLFKETLVLLLQAVPKGMSLGKVEAFLLSQPGVVALHDLHIWALSTRETAMTVHLVYDSQPTQSAAIEPITLAIKQRFPIQHITIQIESPVLSTCENTPGCE